MRKIEREMNKAIAGGYDWKCDNTRVEYNQETDTVSVFLYNNLIAILGENSIQIFDGGVQSKTTKSRLNAILFENGAGGESVYQRRNQWFVRVNEPFKVDYKVIPFTSGMMVE